MRTLEPGEGPKANGKVARREASPANRPVTLLDSRRAAEASDPQTEEARPEKHATPTPGKTPCADWTKVAIWIFLICLLVVSLLAGYQLWGKLHVHSP